MLIDILQGDGTFGEKIVTLVFLVVIVLISLTVHEVAHGYAAYRLGDPTARNFGRLTLNPAKHLDPIGSLMMLLFGFGWANPVPVNTRYFKKPRRDMALTALAGPVSNLLMAFVSCFFMMISLMFYYKAPYAEGSFGSNVLFMLYTFFSSFTFLNVSLAVFNFIPVPPLDGSRILYIFLPPKYYFGVMKYERYISLAIMVLLFTGLLSGPLSFISSAIVNGFINIWGLLPIFG